MDYNVTDPTDSAKNHEFSPDPCHSPLQKKNAKYAMPRIRPKIDPDIPQHPKKHLLGVQTPFPTRFRENKIFLSSSDFLTFPDYEISGIL